MVNPKSIFTIPGMNGLFRDNDGNLYHHQKHWSADESMSKSIPKEFIHGIATIHIHNLNENYIVNVEFKDNFHKSLFYGDIRGIKSNPWKVNYGNIMIIPKKQESFEQLYALIIERLIIMKTDEMNKSFYKFIGSIGL